MQSSTCCEPAKILIVPTKEAQRQTTQHQLYTKNVMWWDQLAGKQSVMIRIPLGYHGLLTIPQSLTQSSIPATFPSEKQQFSLHRKQAGGEEDKSRQQSMRPWNLQTKFL
eukprot:c26152_g1_i1 orf=1040-1369(+)